MNKLKILREKTGLSQSQFAKEVGISVRTLQEYEQGKRSLNGISALTAHYICSFCKCQLTDLISLEKK